MCGLILFLLLDIPLFNMNSITPYRMSTSATCDLSLHCSVKNASSEGIFNPLEEKKEVPSVGKILPFRVTQNKMAGHCFQNMVNSLAGVSILLYQTSRSQYSKNPLQLAHGN